MKVTELKAVKEKLNKILNQYFAITKKNSVIPLLVWITFFVAAIISSVMNRKVFLFFNFVYIGTTLSLGIFMNQSLKKVYTQQTRRLIQILLGGYMLFFVGILSNENIQIEGMFYYLVSGLFSGVVIHYLIAKILGPILFNRGWCGWACWTAMVLDMLPFKDSQGRDKKYEHLRYVFFLISFCIILMLFAFVDNPDFMKHHELSWFVIGNIIYYAISIFLAFYFKDNRAFCKYVCPITVLMKMTSRYAYMKVEINADKCTECGLCEKHCPMDIKLLAYKNNQQRILSTECIMCMSCIDQCENNAISMTMKSDFGFKEYIQYKEENNKNEIKSH